MTLGLCELASELIPLSYFSYSGNLKGRSFENRIQITFEQTEECCLSE
jgi:hypothetical protein